MSEKHEYQGHKIYMDEGQDDTRAIWSSTSTCGLSLDFPDENTQD